MPPKKATAATKTVTKAKSTKRQDEKETAGSESKEEVPEKKVKTNAGKKKLEKENTNEEMRDEKISENKVKAKRGKRKIEKENSDIEEKTDKVPQKKAKVSTILKQCSMFLLLLQLKLNFCFLRQNLLKKELQKRILTQKIMKMRKYQYKK
jgi:hypothetical protein